MEIQISQKLEQEFHNYVEAKDMFSWLEISKTEEKNTIQMM